MYQRNARKITKLCIVGRSKKKNKKIRNTPNYSNTNYRREMKPIITEICRDIEKCTNHHDFLCTSNLMR